MTAAHVVDTHNRMTVRYEDALGNEKTVTADVVGSDQLRDLVVLRLPDTDLQSIRGRADVYTASTGLPVMSVGYSSNPPIGWPNIRVGVLTTLYVRTDPDELVIVETDAAFDPGDSGGPIFDINGNVVGIAQASQFTTRFGGSRVQGRQMGVEIEEVQEVWAKMKQGNHLNANMEYWFWQ